MGERTRSSEFKNRTAATIAGISILAISACGGEKTSATPEDTSSKTVATADASPDSTTQSPETTGSAQVTEFNGKPIDSGTDWMDENYTADPEAGIWQPEGIAKIMDEAPLEKFERSPIEDRLQFVAEREVYFGETSEGAYEYSDQPIGGKRQNGEDLTLYDTNVAFHPLTAKSSPDEIINHMMYADQLGYMQRLPDYHLDSDEEPPIDHETSMKMLSGVFGDTSLDQYQNYNTLETAASIVDTDITETMPIANDLAETKQSFDGVERVHRKIVYKQGGDIYKAEFMFVPYAEPISLSVGVRELTTENGSWVIVEEERSDVSDF